MEPQLAALIRQSIADRYSLFAPEALADLPDTFTITDPCISGHPIVFASRAFLKMTGYSTHEVLGRNARLFQGPRTSRSSVMEIREAIREERAVEVSIVNYRKDGTPFWMLFRMSPVFGKEDGRVVHFVGVQVPILGRRRRRNGVSLCDGDRVSECVFGGSCRREVCSDSLVELGGRVLDLDSADSQGLEIEGPCEANDLEKRIAATAVNNILSVLTHYSESTGRLVCGSRSNLPGPGLLSSSLNISLGRIKQSFVLMDPYLPDVPIVYASDAFLKLTGYSRHEVLGRTWVFLSGPDSDPSVLHQIKESILAEVACTVRILNYRKDTSSFWNLLHISPVRNATGKIAYLVGVHNEEPCKNQDRQGRTPEMWQLSVVGAVKVAVRSSSMVACSSK